MKLTSFAGQGMCARATCSGGTTKMANDNYIIRYGTWPVSHDSHVSFSRIKLATQHLVEKLRMKIEDRMRAPMARVNLARSRGANAHSVRKLERA